jgi:chromosomal replication initiation ATPase DnaA
MIFYGESGSGKTHLCNNIINHFLLRVRIYFIIFIKFVDNFITYRIKIYQLKTMNKYKY